MTEEQPALSIVIINGSVRPGNYTSMASALVADELAKDPGVVVDVIDPDGLDLPFPGTRPDSASAALLRQKVGGAAGIVLATPEYHGSFSSVTKLVIENLGFPSVLSGKPVALLGVAAGAIGAIKSLEQLRGICAHVGAIALPLPVSVANVQKVFTPDGQCLDGVVEERVRSVATNLTNYIRRHVCPAMQLERILREGLA